MIHLCLGENTGLENLKDYQLLSDPPWVEHDPL